MRGAYPVHKPVRRELGLIPGHGQVMSNDQVGADVAPALELGRLGREALALIQRSLDLAADRYQYRKRDLSGVFKLAGKGRELSPFSFKILRDIEIRSKPRCMAVSSPSNISYIVYLKIGIASAAVLAQGGRARRWSRRWRKGFCGRCGWVGRSSRSGQGHLE